MVGNSRVTKIGPMGLAHPIKSKERVQLAAKQVEKIEPPKVPFFKPARPNSKGLVNPIWTKWSCKDYED